MNPMSLPVDVEGIWFPFHGFMEVLLGPNVKACRWNHLPKCCLCRSFRAWMDDVAIQDACRWRVHNVMRKRVPASLANNGLCWDASSRRRWHAGNAGGRGCTGVRLALWAVLREQRVPLAERRDTVLLGMGMVQRLVEHC